jgi:molybdate transport system substrate-binding protein
VYRTDVLAAGKRVRGIDFPESVQAVNDYPIVALRHAPNPAGATAFRDFILSEQTRAVLVAAGFEEP